MHLNALIAELTKFGDGVKIGAANARFNDFYVAADWRAFFALEFVYDVGSKMLIAQPDSRVFIRV